MLIPWWVTVLKCRKNDNSSDGRWGLRSSDSPTFSAGGISERTAGIENLRIKGSKNFLKSFSLQEE
jgi:hypothetical protein